MPLKDLKAKVQAGSHRMTEDQLHWWEDFIKDEQTLRSRWDEMTDNVLKSLYRRTGVFQNRKHTKERRRQLVHQMIQQHDKTNSWKDS